MRAPSKTKVTPQGNWRFTDASGQTFSDQVLKNLIRNVARHREGLRETGKDVDLNPDWQGRVLEEICKQNPHIECGEVGKPPRTITFATLWRFGETVANFIKGGGQLVSQEEADRRSELCQKCPMNSPSTAVCSTCKNSLEWVFNLLAGRQAKGADKLHVCKSCLCSLSIKCWIPLDAISNEGVDLTVAPDFCWLKGPEEV